MANSATEGKSWTWEPVKAKWKLKLDLCKPQPSASCFVGTSSTVVITTTARWPRKYG